MSKLTTGQVVDDLNRILENRQAVLDDDTQALFVEVFGGGRFADGIYQPLTLDGVRELFACRTTTIPTALSRWHRPAGLDNAGACAP